MLRGINLGDHNKMTMPDLEDLCSELGHRDVVTYLRSGNVVFRSRSTSSARVEEGLAAAIQARFGYDVPVVARTADRFTAIAERHPFASRTDDLAKLHVTFLQDAPDTATVAALSLATGGDEYEVVGPEVYLFTPNGYSRSKLTNGVWERALSTVATTRNAKTVAALAALAA
jgi:uncharacterized protein (DUF1697 family)